MKVKTVKKSICSCGFPTLRDDLEVGTEYELDPLRRTIVIFKCGGCWKVIPKVQAVWVETRHTSHGGYLPVEIFGDILHANIMLAAGFCMGLSQTDRFEFDETERKILATAGDALAEFGLKIYECKPR